VVDVLAAANAFENDGFFSHAIGRNEDGNRLADDLQCRVAEDPFGAEIPGFDDSVEILGDDCVVRTLDDGGQPGGDKLNFGIKLNT
jgi:hypothetical protein